VKWSTRAQERLGFALLAVAFAGVGYSAIAALLPKRTLTIAVREGVESVALKKVAQRFSEERGITVKVQEFLYDDLFKKELKEVRSDKSRFDVLMVDDPWMPALLITEKEKDSGQQQYGLKEVQRDTYEQEDGINDFSPMESVAAYCEASTGCNHYYGVPYVGNSQLFCYRTDVPNAARVAQSWEQIRARSTQQHKSLGYVARIGPNNSIVTDFMPILWSYDPKALPVHPEAQSAFGSEEDAVNAFLSMAELVQNEKSSSVSVDDFDVAAYLATGKASMGIVWSAWAMALAKIERARGTSTIHCDAMPGGKQELGAWLLSIPNTARMQDEAEEFIRYATSREQLMIATIDGNPPPRISILRELSGSTIPASRVHTVAAEEGNTPQQQSTECLPGDSDGKKYQECMNAIPAHLREEYGDLFASEYRSLTTARPRPRSRCWREMENILTQHLEPLILSNYKGEPLRKKALDALRAANRELQEKIKTCSTTSLQGNVAESQQLSSR